METPANDEERSQQARPDKSGNPTFSWQTTHASLIDTVKLVMPPTRVLPIVFVPGIMGSNLSTLSGAPVWVLNSTLGEPMGLAFDWAIRDPGARQRILHPKRTSVFSGGNVPKKSCGTIHDSKEYTARGWGEVGEASYHGFLLWLEGKLNSEGYNPATWTDFYHESVSSPVPGGTASPSPKLHPGTVMKMNGLPVLAEPDHSPKPIMSDELIGRSKCRFPVYACGYNWLASNKDAAETLQIKIGRIIDENNRGVFKCQQVILVTHSMGGLVARACAQLTGMADRIAGVVHGVMPSVGAAVAHRRCKIGMRDEDFKASLVIGSTGQEVTAVFAQAPGALQLLPSEDYGPFWLQFIDENGKTLERMPLKDPYKEIYLRKDRWWGLIREEWLNPEDGEPIYWGAFAANIGLAKEFHTNLSGKFHPRTFVFYGAGAGEQASFEKIRWTIRRESRNDKVEDLTAARNLSLSHQQIIEDGTNNVHIGEKNSLGGMAWMSRFGDYSITTKESSWTVNCESQDSCGDGTVPASSGKAPRAGGGDKIREQFRLMGFSHEPAYKNATARTVALYAITKIAAMANFS